MAELVALAEIEQAADRIRGRVRETPLVEAANLKSRHHDGTLLLKLECLQVTGSFKPRGATNTLLSLTPDEIANGIIAASGGNHGLAVAYAGWTAKTRTVVYLPESTPGAKADKIRDWGAEVVVSGAVFDDANTAAQARAKDEGLTYIHPFDDRRVIAGQGTVALDILRADPQIEVLLVAIGGGGLISGIAAAARAINPGIRIIGIEPTGAPTLKDSIAAGELVTLDKIESEAGTLSPRRSAARNLAHVEEYVDDIVLVSDEDMREAARWLWFEMGIAAELSGAAALAALHTGAAKVTGMSKVCALVCGAGTDGMA